MQSHTKADVSREDLHERIKVMSQAADQAITNALKALRNDDKELAARLVENDLAVNDMQIGIEGKCVLGIARSQPVATDLRDFVACLHIAGELERIADLAADIGRLIIDPEYRILKPFVKPIEKLGKQCQSMLSEVMQAYFDVDEANARRIAADDDIVDDGEAAITRDVLKHVGKHPKDLVPGTHALWIAHNFERIADYITNIAERIVYLKSNEMVDLNPT